MAAQTRRWSKLDNAAMIVPASVNGADTRVFRIVCELKESVRPDALQLALNRTIADYPHFNVFLRQGFFWYYLDETETEPAVTPDDTPALDALYRSGARTLLYRVTYFEKRINLEMFHALADGTGAFMFFKKLIVRYLAIVHGLDVSPEIVDTSSAEEKKDDAFRLFYNKDARASQLTEMLSEKAFQIRQEKDEDLRNRLLEGVVSARAFLSLAKENGTTAGILSAALYIEAALQTMSLSDKKRPVVVSVPVNLRQYFPSETSRNFFGVINITYDAALYDGTLQSILPVVESQFKTQLTEERLAKVMNGYSALERNYLVKAIPLFIKELGIRYFTLRAQKGITGTLSNLGKITLPEEVASYVDYFSAFMSTPNLQICVSTFADKMVFGAVSAYTEHKMLLQFFRNLVKRGIPVTLATNDNDRKDAA